jgi:hypothetical protein
MSHIHITGDDEITPEDAERVAKNYNPSIQEQTEEVADEAPDKTPISAEERKALDEKQAPTFQEPFQDGEIRERAPQFQVPGEWVPPYVQARRRKEMMLPNRGAANDLEKRVNAIALYDGAPRQVQEAVKAARKAIADLRAAYDAGSHPDNPRYARDQQAKDDVIVKVAKVTRVVVALEAVARDEAVQEEWFANLTGGSRRSAPQRSRPCAPPRRPTPPSVARSARPRRSLCSRVAGMAGGTVPWSARSTSTACCRSSRRPSASSTPSPRPATTTRPAAS